jgi:hypothetical protein
MDLGPLIGDAAIRVRSGVRHRRCSVSADFIDLVYDFAGATGQFKEPAGR